MQRLSSPSTRTGVRGVLTIHSCPSALRRHIDWAIANILGSSIQLQWQQQFVLAGTYKASCEWKTNVERAAEIASTLRNWHYLYFEVQESNDNGGELFRFTPELGIHRVLTDLSGAALLNENQINSLLRTCLDEDGIREAFAKNLGTPWDLELDKFRGAGIQELTRLHAI